MLLTEREIKIIGALCRPRSGGAKSVDLARHLASKFGWMEPQSDYNDTLLPNAERTECDAKLTELGMRPPWY